MKIEIENEWTIIFGSESANLCFDVKKAQRNAYRIRENKIIIFLSQTL